MLTPLNRKTPNLVQIIPWDGDANGLHWSYHVIIHIHNHVFFLCCVHCIHILVGCGNPCLWAPGNLTAHVAPYLPIPQNTWSFWLTLPHLASPRVTTTLYLHGLVLVYSCQNRKHHESYLAKMREYFWKLGNVYCFTIFLWFPMVSHGFSMFFLWCPTSFLFHQSIKSRTPSHLSPQDIWANWGGSHRPRFRDLTRDRMWPK